MLDAKILTAVLASLVAASFVVNGSAMDYETPEVEDVDTGFDFSSFIDDPVEQVREHFRSYPEPENSVKANLTVENLHQQDITIRHADTVQTGELRETGLGAYSMESENDIGLHSFNGQIDTGNVTLLEGNVESLTSNDVNVSGMMNVEEEVNTTHIQLRGVERTPLTLTDVGGSIESDDASTEFGEGSRVLEINSFSGDIDLYVENETVVIDGRVDRLEAGSFSFGT